MMVSFTVTIQTWFRNGWRNTRESGVAQKDAKSGWVRYDGQWLKDLAFVGSGILPNGKITIREYTLW